MSMKPDPDSNRCIFGDDFEKIDSFGNTISVQRDDLEEKRRTDEDDSSEEEQFSSHPKSDWQPLPVVMETASTAVMDCAWIKKSSGEKDDLYTSLMSSQRDASHKETSYFSGSISQSGEKHHVQDFLSETHSSMLTSESEIKIETNAVLAQSNEKAYMDISRIKDPCSSQHPTEAWSTSSFIDPCQYMKVEKSPSPVEVDVEDSDEVLDSQTFPYVEEPSDDELSDYQPYRSPGTGSSTSPVKITLTELSPTSVSPTTVQHSPKESVLSLGLEGVPIVTLSEPEIESPESNTASTESDSPVNPNIYASGIESSSQDKAQKSPSSCTQDSSPIQVKSWSPKTALPSSMDSGAKFDDSDPSTTVLPPTTAPSSSPPLQYSILREEREAELDSALALESCGEESPKRLIYTSSKGGKKSPQPVKKPTPATKDLDLTHITSSQMVLSSSSPPKEKTEMIKNYPIQGLPELKLEHPEGQVHMRERRRSSQARRGSGKTSAPPDLFQGLTREKVQPCPYLKPDPNCLCEMKPTQRYAGSADLNPADIQPSCFNLQSITECELLQESQTAPPLMSSVSPRIL
ncbi:hypothetical protein DNTS_001643 [Danionella cerebrum]|uniref:Uncharacterized protein n=1 Tax=Danionella cerebrum TaxID=2873325 RepID=A0A553R060_9TELE|nr:hypothetical protein DNTS_001643 [Danionella translucida]